MSELTNLSLIDTCNLLKNKDVSVMEVTQAYINRAKEFRHLNAFTELAEEKAPDSAKKAQENIDNNTAGIIEGAPIGVKDLFCTKNLKTTACSKMLHNFIPPYESTVTQMLQDNGGIILGKTNMDEFAMGSANTYSTFGNVINPWSKDGEERVPGGSSGGSAAAVAARLCLGALGSDTGGSIRQPASFCGIVGLKPSYGRCSRFGMVSFASSLDQAGVLAHSVKDSALLLESIWGHDSRDSTTAQLEVPRLTNSINGEIRKMKIGIPKEYRMDGMNSEIDGLWQKGAKMLEDSGAEIVEVDLPYTKHALSVYYIIAPAEASSNLARYDGVRYGYRAAEYTDLDEMYSKTRAQGFGSEVKRRIMIGTYVLSSGYYDAYYLKAQKVRRLIAQDFNNVFEKVDCLLTPTTPGTAFRVGEKQDDPLAMYLNDVFTVPASLAGLPAISVPAGSAENGLPLGLQLIGNRYDEQSIINAAFALEQQSNFKSL